MPIAKSSLLLGSSSAFAEFTVYLSNMILSVLNVSVVHQLTCSPHRNISYFWTSKYFVYNYIHNIRIYVTNSVFVTTVKKYWMMWWHVFIVHCLSRKLHKEIRKMRSDFLLSISISVDFRCGNFDNEILHKCLDAHRLLFSPNVSKFEIFGQIFAKAPTENSSRQVDLVHTEGRTADRGDAGTNCCWPVNRNWSTLYSYLACCCNTTCSCVLCLPV
jgi:hypothetical protein